MYKLLFHNGSFKKKVLKYGTPKPRFRGFMVSMPGHRGFEAHPEILKGLLGGAGDLVSKVIDRVIFGVTPFRVLITLLITYLLSPLPLQVGLVLRR